MAEHEKLSHGALFGGFFRAGIIGFGGVLPFARRLLVEQRGWLTTEEFNDLFSLCQFMPGANIVNLAFAFGARHRGVSGAGAAVAGLLAAPVAVVLVLGTLYGRYGGVAVVQHGLAGLAAAACGLVVATAAKIAWPVVRKRERPVVDKSVSGAPGGAPFSLKDGLAAVSLRGVLVTCMAFGMVVIGHVSLPLTMLLLLPFSVVLAWRS